MTPSILWKTLRDRTEKKQEEAVSTDDKKDQDKNTLDTYKERWKEMTTSCKGWSMKPYKEFREFERMKLIPAYGVAQVAEVKTPEAQPIKAAQEEKTALQLEIEKSQLNRAKEKKR